MYYGLPNYATYNIEFCHPDYSGKPSDATYEALIEYVTYLLDEFNLTVNDVVRHSDIVKPEVKQCQKFYVVNPGEWQLLLAELLVRSETHMNEETRLAALEALESLRLKGFVSNPEYWAEMLGKPIPAWAFFIIMKRIVNDYGEKIDDFDKLLGGR